MLLTHTDLHVEFHLCALSLDAIQTRKSYCALAAAAAAVSIITLIIPQTYRELREREASGAKAACFKDVYFLSEKKCVWLLFFFFFKCRLHLMLTMMMMVVEKDYIFWGKVDLVLGECLLLYESFFLVWFEFFTY